MKRLQGSVGDVILSLKIIKSCCSIALLSKENKYKQKGGLCFFSLMSPESKYPYQISLPVSLKSALSPQALHLVNTNRRTEVRNTGSQKSGLREGYFSETPPLSLTWCHDKQQRPCNIRATGNVWGGEIIYIGIYLELCWDKWISIAFAFFKRPPWHVQTGVSILLQSAPSFYKGGKHLQMDCHSSSPTGKQRLCYDSLHSPAWHIISRKAKGSEGITPYNHRRRSS